MTGQAGAHYFLYLSYENLMYCKLKLTVVWNELQNNWIE
jgi:hypothetical protein